MSCNDKKQSVGYPFISDDGHGAPSLMSGKRLTVAVSIFLAATPSPLLAGPPFLTDDPEPTELGHWEIYSPLIEADGKGESFSGSVGAELNYGAAPNLQLTLGLPAAYEHGDAGWRWGAGDLAFSAKYRFYHDAARGFSIAAFPGLTFPTGTNGMSTGKVTALLPIWAQKDIGPWSIFGGGGYAINPGLGRRDYWTSGIACTRSFSEHLLLGLEADRQGADTKDGRGSTSLGFGAIYQLKTPLRLLASGGPSFDDAGGRAGFHAFAALGLDL
jgi:hypothetical protein